ncbi:hypothetical protein MASR2M15_29590 [Anaerolineales bacterium]
MSAGWIAAPMRFIQSIIPHAHLVDPEGVLRTSFGYATTPQEMTDALLWFMEQER